MTDKSLARGVLAMNAWFYHGRHRAGRFSLRIEDVKRRLFGEYFTCRDDTPAVAA